ncbi:MAG: AarF/UbiB family protein [Candidatus Puniceispirillum sp.]|jgi:predicted unusual protein kinase regulating ubiquinone biosynthesis (AarF/ABC1/UbiB family)
MADDGYRDRMSGGQLGGRLRRYARVTTTMGGLAARVAGERYLGWDIDRTKHAADLRQALGGLKGPIMKVAQILSTIPDALPPEYAEELAGLQADAPAMGWLFTKRRMAAELGADWQQNFTSFSRDAVSAASLGQVHKATGQDGAPLAVKLQYPDMSSAIEADLRQLKILFQLYERYDSAISTSDIYDELSERLLEELDYQREAQNMQLYRRMLADEDVVNVPHHIAALSTRRLLTMNWLDGTRLMPFLETDPDQETRNKIARNMFRVWYVPFYFYGVIHGDPHLGNYSIGADHKINLMDFGSIRLFRPEFVAGVIELYQALRDNDPDQAVHAYERWGFVGLDREAIDVLNMWAGFIYAPLLEDRVRPIQQMRGGKAGRELAGKVHAELKRIGGIKPPREFVLMDRAAVGLGSVFMHLGAEVNWHTLFHDLIDGFDVDALGARQKALAEEVGLPATLIDTAS